MTDPGSTQDTDLFYWLALAMAPGVGTIRFDRLLERFHSPEAVFRASSAELATVPSLPKSTIEALTRFGWDHKVTDELKRTRERGLKLLTRNSLEYPDRLKQIWDPPPVLWMDGEYRPEDEVMVALVGSRQATEYGLRTAYRLAAELADAGVHVVSGLAAGIDAASHWGAIEAKGRTTGVLGCGIDIIYPASNRGLYQKIPQQGALISEFPLGVQPKAGHFPKRNRIISGMCLAVVVVEAAAKSGAAITARLALEQNREVLAVPGPAGSDSSRGANALLKQGARLVETGQDIIDEIAPQLGSWKPLADRPESGRGGRLIRPAADDEPPDMAEEEKRIWLALAGDGLHIDVLGRSLGLPAHSLAAMLLDMELKGLVSQLPGMRYKRNNG